MKTYSNLFDKMLEPENMEKCFKSAAKGKRKREAVKRAFDNKDYHLNRLRDRLISESFYFTPGRTAIINKSSYHKERLITKPKFLYDQVVHHLIVSQFRPIVEKSLYEFAIGSIPGRGVHFGKKTMEKWIRSYGNKRFYVFKCDIRHFYDSVDTEILKQKLSRKITDKKFLRLLFNLIDTYAPGIPKGCYTSQWFANFLLTDLDHYIKEELHAPFYMRYLDDMVILSPNKRRLHYIKDRIEEYLATLNLELKGNWQIYRFKDKDNKTGRDLDFMGFRFFRRKTILRKSLLKRIRRKANHIKAKDRISVNDARSMLSYLGWTKHADVYGYFQKYIKPKVNPRYLRKKISREDKA